MRFKVSYNLFLWLCRIFETLFGSLKESIRVNLSLFNAILCLLLFKLSLGFLNLSKLNDSATFGLKSSLLVQEGKHELYDKFYKTYLIIELSCGSRVFLLVLETNLSNKSSILALGSKISSFSSSLWWMSKKLLNLLDALITGIEETSLI